MVVAPRSTEPGMVMVNALPTEAEKVPVRIPSIEISWIGSATATATTPPWSSLTSESAAVSLTEKLVTMRPVTLGVPYSAELTAVER